MEITKKITLIVLLILFFPSITMAFPVVTSKVGSKLNSSTWNSHTSSKQVLSYTKGFVQTVSGKSDKQRTAEDVAAMVREGFSVNYALKFVNKSDYYTNNRGGLSFVNYSNSKTTVAKTSNPTDKSPYTFVDPVKNQGIKITGNNQSSTKTAVTDKGMNKDNNGSSDKSPTNANNEKIPGGDDSDVDSPSYQQEQEVAWNIGIIPENDLHVTDHFDPDGENFVIRIECSVPFNRILLEFCGYPEDFDGSGRLIISRDIYPVYSIEFVQNVHYKWPVNDAPVTVCAWTVDGDLNYSRIFVDVNAFNPYLKQ